MTSGCELPEGMKWSTDRRSAMLTVRILRVSDGMVREHFEEHEMAPGPTNDEDIDGIRYIWTDGNWGCDCNRALFFARAAGEPDPDVSCNVGRSDAAYRVIYPSWLSD